MKKLTYEDWQKNPTPREMWVWNNSEEEKRKRKVIYISKETYPVVTISFNDEHVEHYGNCAEIEKSRLMTQRELSRWLREKPTREYKFGNDSYIFNNYVYKEGCENEDVSEKIRIREDYEEWKEPLIQIEYE